MATHWDGGMEQRKQGRGKAVLELGLERMNARSSWAGREEMAPDSWAMEAHGRTPGYN